MRIRRALVVASAAVALAGCGGGNSSGTSASAWVKSLCNAVVPLKNDAQNQSRALQFSPTSTLAKRKQGLQSFISAMVNDSARAVSAVKSAGTPNVSNGKSISSKIVIAFTGISSGFVKAQSQANALSTTDPAAFSSGARALIATVQSSLSNVGASLGGLSSPDLDKAAKKTPACASLLS